MYSNKLTPEDNSTYRIVHFEDDITDQYQVGTTFVWTSFTSSSVKNIMFFGNTEFVFNNSQTSLVSPKRIEQYSWYEEEAEALYPPTAMLELRRKRTKARKLWFMPIWWTIFEWISCHNTMYELISFTCILMYQYYQSSLSTKMYFFLLFCLFVNSIFVFSEKVFM